jgi:ElaB/YqjD/DUF883 family membrane-anchored ribosome-binding protein
MSVRANAADTATTSHRGGSSPTNGASDGAFAAGLSREFRDFLADVEDLIKATTSLTGDELARARARLNERVSEARESVEALGAEVDQGARRGAAVTDTFVHDQPWKAIGVGAAVGVVFGFLLARRG